MKLEVYVLTECVVNDGKSDIHGEVYQYVTDAIEALRERFNLVYSRISDSHSEDFVGKANAYAAMIREHSDEPERAYHFSYSEPRVKAEWRIECVVL